MHFKKFDRMKKGNILLLHGQPWKLTSTWITCNNPLSIHEYKELSNENVEHDIITRDANSVSWAEIWEFSKSQRDIIDAVTISKIVAFDIICYVAYYSAAKLTFPIEQPSNKAAKCGIRRSYKLKVKPKLGWCSNIAITISYITVSVSSC